MRFTTFRYPALALGLCGTFLLSGCGKKEADTKGRGPQAPVPVTLVDTKRDIAQRTVEVVGTLFGDDETTISAKVPGRVTEILKDIGDRAALGEPLAQIDVTDYDLAVSLAQLAVEQSLSKLGLTEMPGKDFDPDKVPTVQQKRLEAANAEARYRRAEQLFNQKPPLISEQDYSDQKTAFEVAKSALDVVRLEARSFVAEARSKQAEVRQAGQQLTDATVRAPGTPEPRSQPTTQDRQIRARYAVAARQVSVGEYVAAGTAMFRLVADDPVKCRASVPERYIGQIQLGQLAFVKIESNPTAFEGRISRINPQIDQASRSFQVEIIVPNPEGFLRPGAFARASIQTRIDKDVFFVPKDSVVSFAGLSKVFTIANNKAIEARVNTGKVTGDWIEITGGLKPTDKVVGEGAERLATDVPVEIKSNVAINPTTLPAEAKAQ